MSSSHKDPIKYIHPHWTDEEIEAPSEYMIWGQDWDWKCGYIQIPTPETTQLPGQEVASLLKSEHLTQQQY